MARQVHSRVGKTQRFRGDRRGRTQTDQFVQSPYLDQTVPGLLKTGQNLTMSRQLFMGETAWHPIPRSN
jgi:hypothetical protein